MGGNIQRKIFLIVQCVIASVALVNCLNNGLGYTPQMGKYCSRMLFENANNLVIRVQSQDGIHGIITAVTDITTQH